MPVSTVVPVVPSTPAPAVTPVAAPGPGDAPLLELVGGSIQVPLVTGEHVRFANLDNAASTSALRAVQEAVDEFLPWYSSVHRGAGFPSQVSTAAYTAAREVVRTFVGGRADDTVLFTRNTTDALNLLAGAMPPGTEVITFAGEHHANLLPWRRGSVRHLPVPGSPEGIVPVLDAALRTAGAGPKLVAVTGASNVTGERWPVAEIARVAHRHGARIVVDAAQLAPHRPIDVAAWDVDYVAFSGHKLYAPLGAGALVGRADWLDAGAPYLAGGGAVARVTLDDVDWANGPARHEAGTPAVVGAVALAAACRALEQAGWPAIEAHEAALLARLRDGLAAIDGVTTYASWDAGHERVGVVAFNLAGWDHARLAAALSAEEGIGVRDGAFCAHPLLRELIAPDAGRRGSAGDAVPGAVRASVGVGTRADDVDRLLRALARLARDGARWTYALRDGYVVPTPDPRPRPHLSGLLDALPATAAAPASCAGR